MKLEIFFDGFLGLADVDREDEETLVGKLMTELFDDGLFFGAEVTPGSPEFEKNHFALDGSVREFLACGGGGVEVRSGFFRPFAARLRRGGGERSKEQDA